MPLAEPTLVTLINDFPKLSLKKLLCDDAAQNVVHEANVTYMAEDLEDGTTVAIIGPRKGPLDDRVYHPKVLAAYEAARSATFETMCDAS